MGDLELQTFLTDGVAGVLVDGRRELWVKAKSRKVFVCCLCKKQGKVGHWCWRTTSNGLHRAKRVCDRCWDPSSVKVRA